MSGGETSGILSELRIVGAKLVPQASGSPAEAVKALDLADPVVLAVPRRVVTIGFEVAQVLGAPLDIQLGMGSEWSGTQELPARMSDVSSRGCCQF